VPRIDFFVRFGVFAVKNFVDRSECAELIEEMRRSRVIPATLSDASVNRDQRRANEAVTMKDSHVRLERKLLDLRPELENHFKDKFSECEGPQFLIYSPGDFHCPHVDRPSDSSYPEYAKNRKITLSINLNSDSDPADHYEGGLLTLYGLPGKAWQSCGFPLEPETGLLVAFPADLMHEVSPVLHGERFSVVSWFS